MSKDFEKYLQEGGFNQQDKDTLAQAKEEALSKNQSPGDLQNSHTPNPKDAGKQNHEGQNQSVEEAAQALKKHTIMDNWPAKTSKLSNSLEKEQEKDSFDR